MIIRRMRRETTFKDIVERGGYDALSSSRRVKDLRGKRFERLLVVEYYGYRVNSVTGAPISALWKVRCDCNPKVEFVTTAVYLRVGDIKSCGCYGQDLARTRATKHSRHGSPEYRSWQAMLTRCTNEKGQDYKDYGGRGIRVCERWQDFSAFLEDMGERPSLKHTLDRVDVDDHYYKENCRWASPEEQQLNKRGTIFVEYQGQRVPLRTLATSLGVPYHLLHGRLKRGWSLDRTITEPLNKRFSHPKSKVADPPA